MEKSCCLHNAPLMLQAGLERVQAGGAVSRWHHGGGLHVPIWGCVAKHPGLETGAPLTLRWVLGCALRVLLSSISWDWCCGLCLSSARGSW